MQRYEKNLIRSRLGKLKFIATVLFISLIGRLYYVQLYENEILKLNSLRQRSTEVILSPNRGTIFDRNLIPLTNGEVEKTAIIPKNNKLLYIPVDENTTINDKKYFVVDMVHRYSKENLLSHTIGYINKAENRGETGIEKVYDEFLRNTDKTSFFVEYDKDKSIVLGSSYYVDNVLDPYEPAGVMLTIDMRIQKIVESVLDFSGVKGAVIVTDIEEGDILALASRPNFDQDDIMKYLSKDDMALYNKAIQASYPPGSIFKIVVLLTALEEQADFLSRTFHCKGYEVINNTTIKCSNSHGDISLKDGFAKSCNSVFIQIGKELGAKKIISMAKRLGLGSKINIGLLEEIEGILPEGEELLGPAIGNISIGQGKIEVTPLQIANILQIIANGGVQKHITLVKGITTKEGYMLKPYNKGEEYRVISKANAEIAKEFLEEVLNTGTARSLNLEEIGGAAGKTGSAEGTLKGEFTIHGWFAGYYPKKLPKYVITILVEEASSGSKSAAPIFERICKEIYEKSL